MPSDIVQSQSAQGAPAPVRAARLLGVWARAWSGAALTLVILGAIAIRFALPLTSDVSWLISVCDALLDGKRLYIDIIELNPPASVWLYMPATALARLVGVPAEFCVGAFVFLLIGAAAELVLRIEGAARNAARTLVWLATIVVIFAMLPRDAFGQRDHVAAILALPYVAIARARLRGRTIPAPLLIAVGILAGAAVCIKPYFALGFAAPALLVITQMRKPALLFAWENLVAGGVAALYLAIVWIAYPAFWNVLLPQLLTLYQPVREFFDFDHLRPAAVWAGLIGAACVVFGRAAWARGGVCLAASCGFALAYFAQGKYWPYQALPMIAFALLALADLIIDRAEAPGATPRPHPVAVGLCGAAALLYVWKLFAPQDDWRGLAEAIARVKQNPGVIAISGDLAIGHPATRLAGGHWAGTLSNQWIASSLRYLNGQVGADEATRARRAADDRWAKDLLARDLNERRPDIVLMDRSSGDWLRWADRDPAIRAALQNYRVAQSVRLEKYGATIDIMARTSP